MQKFRKQGGKVTGASEKNKSEEARDGARGRKGGDVEQDEKLPAIRLLRPTSEMSGRRQSLARGGVKAANVSKLASSVFGGAADRPLTAPD